ncbi:hypothetical protein [Comamonas aquatica]|uniref:hypothetical protein n=1 Tax=Comamonas aquatica TaxID=225991 RepID=UPI0024471E4B|nr:hypothetical protein [Comamonas aquatica]MDH0494143.1 hypothetical protein [Comamonas aquatica]
MNLQPWLPAQDSPEVIVNENFEALSHIATFAKDPITTTGLTWGYIGGRWGGVLIPSGTLTLAANKTLYITASRSSGVVGVSDSTAAWDNEVEHARIYKVATATSTVTSVEDYRAGAGGVHGITTTAPSGSGGGGASPVVPIATTSYAITPSDAGNYMRFTATAEKTVTLDVAAGFAAGQEYHLANRATSGDLGLFAIGIALNAPKGGLMSLEPKDTVTVKFVTPTEADVFGSTKVAP